MFLLINVLLWGTCSLLLSNSNGGGGKEEIKGGKWLREAAEQKGVAKRHGTGRQSLRTRRGRDVFFFPAAFVLYCFPPLSPSADPLNIILLKLPDFLRPESHCRSLCSAMLEWIWNVYESFGITCECLSVIPLNSLVWEDQVISTSQCFCCVSS